MLRRLRDWPIRAKIALAIFCLSAGALVAMSIAVYAAFEHALTDNLDDTLRLRQDSNMALVDLTASPPKLGAGPDPGSELSRGEAVLRLFAPSGEVLKDGSPATMTSDSERDLVLTAVARDQSVYRTIDLNEDRDFRVVATPLESNGSIVAILVTGVERSQVNEPIAVLRIILVLAIPLTSIGLGLGSYWIARVALGPVSRITATARRISGGDLRSRIEGVHSKDEVGELADTLNAMIARLAETVERERRFTADAAHELRTPLAAIEASVDVTLGQQRTEAEYRHALEAAKTQSRRLARLTQQLLLLSRLDARDVEWEFEPIEIAELLDAVVATFLDTHPAAQVEVRDEGPGTRVRGDVELLARAFMNVLENAALHVGDDVAIDVRMTTDIASRMTTISIVDNGEGFPEALADRAFHRFAQGDESRSRGGSGLGLAITAAIISVHGGEARIVREPGAGGNVEITLPTVR